MNVRHPMDVLHFFSINNTFYDKKDLRLFQFHPTIRKQGFSNVSWNIERNSALNLG